MASFCSSYIVFFFEIGLILNFNTIFSVITRNSCKVSLSFDSIRRFLFMLACVTNIVGGCIWILRIKTEFILSGSWRECITWVLDWFWVVWVISMWKSWDIARNTWSIDLDWRSSNCFFDSFYCNKRRALYFFVLIISQFFRLHILYQCKFFGLNFNYSITLLFFMWYKRARFIWTFAFVWRKDLNLLIGCFLNLGIYVFLF